MTTDTIEAETKALTALEKARSFEIVEVQDRVLVENDIRLLKMLEDEITATFGPLVKKAHETHKAILAEQNKALVPVNDARKLLKQKAMAWDNEQEIARREEENRLRDIARRQAEEEALNAAAQAEADGDHEVAEAIVAAPVVVPQVTIPKAFKAGTLTSGRSTWSATCFDAAAFIKAAASGNSIALSILTTPAAIEFIESKMRPMAVSMKQGLNVPGIRSVETRA